MNAETKRQHKVAGLCVDCSRPQYAGTTRCEVHLEAQRAHDTSAAMFRRPEEDGSVITYDDLAHDSSYAFEVLRRVKALVATEMRLRHRMAGDEEIKPVTDRTEALRVRTRVRLTHRMSANEEIRQTTKEFERRFWDAVMGTGRTNGYVLRPTTLEEVQRITALSRPDLFRLMYRWSGRNKKATEKAAQGVVEYQ
jgi:hypothetical protein